MKASLATCARTHFESAPLSRAIGDARLLVAVEDSRRARDLSQLFAERDHRFVEIDRDAEPLDAALHLVQAGIDFRLGRHDAFVCAAGERGTNIAGFAAAIFRRSTRFVRLGDALPASPRVRIGYRGRVLGATPRHVVHVESGDGAAAFESDGAAGALPIAYDVRFTASVLDALPEYTAGRRVLAIVDGYPGNPAADIARIVGAGNVHVMRLAAPEKDMRAVLEVIDRIEDHDLLLAVGGGTLMDVVGFAAAIHGDGCRYVRVPTTLVGMIDAGVGLKVGVNFGAHKNFIGAYYPPVACLCDVRFLDTLPADEIRCGLSEAVKIAAVRNAPLFSRIESDFESLLTRFHAPETAEILAGAAGLMLEELESNPFEDDLRRLPDFGHEFGHAIESLTGFQIRHGDAVAIGIALSSSLAVATGLLPRDELDRILRLLLSLDLPIHHPCCDPQILWRKVEEDVLPHKAGKLHLVVPRRIGHGGFIDEVAQIDLGMLTETCRELSGYSLRWRKAS